MNRSLLTGAALLIGAAIAAPAVIASAAEDQAQLLAQAGPDRPGPGGMGGPMGGEMDGRQMGGGPMATGERGGPHGWMGRMHGMMHMAPQQRCEERLARRAGIVAYVVAKLNLNQQQKPVWDKLDGVLQDNAGRERELCATLKPRDQREQETMLDRLKRREQFLSARLQGLQQAEPALEQLYNALTPEQKAIVDHPFRH